MLKNKSIQLSNKAKPPTSSIISTMFTNSHNELTITISPKCFSITFENKIQQQHQLENEKSKHRLKHFILSWTKNNERDALSQYHLTRRIPSSYSVPLPLRCHWRIVATFSWYNTLLPLSRRTLIRLSITPGPIARNQYTVLKLITTRLHFYQPMRPRSAFSRRNMRVRAAALFYYRILIGNA